MTDNPSSSVPPLSKGEIGITRQSAVILSAYTGYLLVESFGLVQEYAEKLLDRPIFTHEFALKELCAEVGDAIRSSGDFARATNLIDSALASQEARRRETENILGNLLARIHRDGGHHQAEVGTKQAALDAEMLVMDDKRQIDNWRHRVDDLEARHRQEMEEAKREKSGLRAALAAEMLQRAIETGRFQDRLSAAEQREREAGEREKVLGEALKAILSCREGGAARCCRKCTCRPRRHPLRPVPGVRAADRAIPRAGNPARLQARPRMRRAALSELRAWLRSVRRGSGGVPCRAGVRSPGAGDAMKLCGAVNPRAPLDVCNQPEGHGDRVSHCHKTEGYISCWPDTVAMDRIKKALGLRADATLDEIAAHVEWTAADVDRLHSEKMALLYPSVPGDSATREER